MKKAILYNLYEEFNYLGIYFRFDSIVVKFLPVRE